MKDVPVTRKDGLKQTPQRRFGWRFRVSLGVLVLLLVGIGVAGRYMFSMPGQSWDGEAKLVVEAAVFPKRGRDGVVGLRPQLPASG